jgi:hypothetical protein
MAVFWIVAPCRAIALMMEAARASETLVHSYRLHGATTQKTVIFVLTAVKTSNPFIP